LYSRRDSVETSWAIMNPILETWKKNGKVGLYKYESGCWGPKEADNLLKQDEKFWINY
jgi:glucose-6-phosphate 1-dehydrogenase